MSTEIQPQDAAPLSTKQSNMRTTAAGLGGARFAWSNSAPGFTYLSTRHGSQYDSTSPAAGHPHLPGHPGHMQERYPLPQLPSSHSDISHAHAHYRRGKPGQARNTTAPTAYRPFHPEGQQQIALSRGQQQSSASGLFSPSGSREYDQHAAPSLLPRANHDPNELLIPKEGRYVPNTATAAGSNSGGRSQEIQRNLSPQPDFSPQPENDPDELFFFKGREPYSAAAVSARNHSGSLHSNDARYEASANRFSGRTGQKDDATQPGLNSLSSSGTRVPTPGLGPILCPERTGRVVAPYQDNKPGPRPAARGSGFGIDSTGYYDYSEGFSNSSTWFPHMSTRPTLVASPDRVEPHGIQMPCENDEDDYPDPDVAHQYHFANLPVHIGGERMKPGQPAYSNRRRQVPPSHYQPLRGYANGDTYVAHPQGFPPRIGPLPHQNRGGAPCAYPYPQSHRMAYQDGNGYRGRRRNDGGYHVEQHYAGRYHREGPGVGGPYRSRRDVVDNSSNQENMAPLLNQRSRRAEFPSRETSRTRRNITHAHRKVQEMMKAWIPHGQEPGFIDKDGAAIHLSYPIPLEAPRPVSINTRQRLEEHVLSINDDETLPDKFRNLHNGPSGSSDVDGLSDATCHRLAPAGIARFGRNGLHRHHEAPTAVQNIRWRDTSGNARVYATPRILGSGRKQFSRRNAPCPAETPAELEYQSQVQAEPEVASNAESRSMVGSENNKWESAKESMLARLGIKTKRMRNAEATVGHTLLMREAERGMSGFSNSDNPHVELDDNNTARIERWRDNSGGDDGQGDGTRDQTGDCRPNTTTGAGNSAAFPGLRERLTHLKGKGKALRSKSKL